MDKKYGILIIGTVILSLCFVGAASAKTWYVDDDGGSDFIGIQDAITKANASDTIIVRDGTYTENIEVNKCLTIKSENGTVNCIIRAANQSDHVFEVTAAYVNISGFTVKNSISSAGISLNDVNHCNISYNKASNNIFGISLKNSSNCNISNNKASNNSCGISLENSNDNNVMNNTASNNAHGEIGLHSSSKNIVEEKIASSDYGEIGFGGVSSYSSNNSIKNSSFNNHTNTPFFRGKTGLEISSPQVCAPGDDNKTLVNHPKDVFDVDWVEDAEISKYDNSTTINISTDEHSAEIIMNEKKEKALLKISDGRTHRLKVKMANDKKQNKSENSDTVRGSKKTIESENSDTVRGSKKTIESEKKYIIRLPRYSSELPEFPLINAYGIYLSSSSNNTIKHNIANSNNGNGISLNGFSSNNTIINNTINFNFLGIDIQNSYNNTISNNNNASFNEYFGIYLYNSSHNNVKNNTASFNKYFGILLFSSDNNNITGNYANSTKNGTGIYLYNSSSENTIEDNTVNSNSYDGIAIGKSSDYNIVIRNNTACFNNESGILLFSSNDNNVIDNNLSSNSFGLSLMELEFRGNTNDNQIKDNNLNSNKYCGISLWDLRYSNNITDNIALNNNLFGIFVCNSTNQTISFNKANFSERGIGLHESRDILLINNIANANKISGISLIHSTNNRILNNSASFNIYEGIYLSNSNSNNISNNNVSSNKYFGISLYSSDYNNITDNDAESNYYSEIFLYRSNNNTIDYIDYKDKEPYIQEEKVHGVRLYLLTPSFQTIGNRTNASYYIVVENLGNSRDTFNLSISSVDNPKILSLDKEDNVSLDAGAEDFSTNTISEEVKVSQLTKIEVAKTNVETIKLTVGDTKPGIYGVKVTARSVNDTMVKDVIETRTLVHVPIASPKIAESAIINSSINNNSIIKTSAIINSSINNDSIIKTSAIINSTISDSNITGSVITNSEVVNTPLNDVIVEGANISSGNIFSGNITINGIKYEITNKTRIPLTNCYDSNLVGIKNKPLEINATNSGICFNISAKKDYFAGSMSVQKSSIPPDGIPELTNNVGGYVYTNASDNLNNSKSWVNISVYYNQNELDDLDEGTLRLRYFNENADPQKWEYLPINRSGVNRTGNYVWGNISHFSVFAVSGAVTPRGPGGGPPKDSDGDGLPDFREFNLGTDPNNPDTDGDGFKDGDDPFPLDPNLPLRPTPTPTLTPTPTTPITPTPTPTPTPISTPIPTPEPKPLVGWEVIFVIFVIIIILIVIVTLLLYARKRI